jgi:protease I
MMKLKWAAAAAFGCALFSGVIGLTAASNIGPDLEVNATTPHQELMAFLLRGPANPELLAGKRVAVIIENGTDAVTFQLARDYLVEQGATVEVLTPRGEASAAASIPASQTAVISHDYAGNERLNAPDAFLDEADARGYQAVYLPGNHPDTQTLEGNTEIASYVARAASAGIPVFAMGDSSLLLARGNLLRGRHATGARSVHAFLVWSGVAVSDEPVVRDSAIYTSRDAFDLPRLMGVMTRLLTTP